MKQLRILGCALSLLVACWLTPVFATPPSPIPLRAELHGDWNGEIAVPGSPLSITVRLHQNAQGQWQGTVDIPAQKAYKLPLENISVTNNTLGFAIAGVPGNPTFAGTLTPAGELKGSFTQGGQQMTFSLHKPAVPKVTAADLLKTLPAFFEQERQKWNVPGMAVCIVKDGNLIFSQGFGLRDVEKKQPVTTDTLFAIGSTTKAFTALLLAQLVEEGVLEWNKPIKHYLPDFVLKDPMATSHMTARDLVNHISGLPRHDLMWYGSALSRQELFERLRHLEPNASFRESFQYQNLMFMTAGVLAEKLLHSRWEEAIQKRILTPLGMAQSNFSIKDMQQGPSFAWPYQRQQKMVKKMAFRNIDAVGPAGSLNASIKDMARWVQFQLGAGELEGHKLLSPNGMKLLHAPQVVANSVGSFTEIPYSLYGNGWAINPYRGKTVVEHGGNIDGFSAQVGLIPELNVGVAVLTNMNASPLPQLVAYAVYDAFIQLPPIDWSSRFKAKVEAREKAQAGASASQEIRTSGTQPTHPLADYPGRYSHPGYGEVMVTPQGKTLEMAFNSQKGKLEHWHYDVFRLVLPGDAASLLVQFQYNNQGDIDSLKIPMEMAVEPLIFKRLPDQQLSTPAFLKTLTGRYTLNDSLVPVTVSLAGDQLSVEVHGQPAYKLVPTAGKNTFKFRDLAGFKVRFIVEGSQVKRLMFLQPNGVFVALKKP